MASRFQSISKPAFNLLKSAMKKPNKPIPPTPLRLPSHPFSRVPSEMGCIQSLLPLHSAVSSARLTSCLGVDSRNSGSLYQGTLCRSNPGV
ncbi:hypothetical protein AAC387_Pa03g4556 [Persea americana]